MRLLSIMISLKEGSMNSNASHANCNIKLECKEPSGKQNQAAVLTLLTPSSTGTEHSFCF